MWTLFGGLGLFLFGMVAMTDGLKAFAGDRLRTALLKFTGRPLTAFFSGFVATSMVQSSSATTLATIGFVSAGLIPFAQSVGIVFGASLGTTSTGWLVSVLGLKFSISALALPVVGTGALMRLVTRGRWRELGTALAGFGLVFIGIDFMKLAMEGLTDNFTLSDFAVEGFLGHLLLLGIGFLMTVLMQSSSAAVAITLTALSTGVIEMEQAASLVIGQAIGTTVTAVIASFGGSVAAKRTALAHVLFNTFTGLIALVLLPVFMRVLRYMDEVDWLEPGPISLAAFHTSFILLGVIIFLPLAGPFSRMIERILKEPEDKLTGNLDSSLLTLPSVALGALGVSLERTYRELLTTMKNGLDANFKDEEGATTKRDQLRHALERQQTFLARIAAPDQSVEVRHQRISFLHAIDHLDRLASISYPVVGIRRVLGVPTLRETEVILLECISSALVPPGDPQARKETLHWIQRQAEMLEREKEARRPEILEQTASGQLQPEEALEILDAIRWISKVAYHLWRIHNYLYPASEEPNGEPTPEILSNA